MFRNIWSGVKAAWRVAEQVSWWIYILSLCSFVAVWVIGSLHAGRLLTEDDLIWLIFGVR
jgi:uncharacterized membrane protein